MIAHLDDAARSGRGGLSLFGAAFFFVLLVFVPILGPEVNGARRWINFGLGQVQPSEFLKPFFVVAHGLAAEPQGSRQVASGLSASRPSLIGGDRLPADEAAGLRKHDHLLRGVGGDARARRASTCESSIGLARRAASSASSSLISSIDVATQRIDEFLFGTGDNFQVENAMRTLTAGGLFGMGPGGGTRKFGLPEPHTDYIFSVIGEEFGLIACLAIACLYLGIVARVLIKLLDEDNSFAILAAAGPRRSSSACRR